ncbi:MAG: DNA repair protein RecN [Acidimicrobiaceae bacterium]|nr:DNA repair protein RecN [Acidimicrobiaceae bacterium]
MLTELNVRNLGVIEELTLLLDRGMTAITGETGSGKTLILNAIDLIAGGRADSGQVRPGAEFAEVEGRFIVNANLVADYHCSFNEYHEKIDPPTSRSPNTSDVDDDIGNNSEEKTEEIIVRRIIPRKGRSRCYIGGRLATVKSLASLGSVLVELHKQNTHQKLLATPSQRAALDRFAGTETATLTSLKQELQRIDETRAALGGDERERLREIDLLRYQLTEIETADIEDADEDERLKNLEEVISEASAHHDAAQTTLGLLNTESFVSNGLSQAIATLQNRTPFALAVEYLTNAEAEIAEAVAAIRTTVEAIDDDPNALAAIRERRQQLAELRRKYGSSLHEVIEFSVLTAQRLAELENRDKQAAALDEQRHEISDALAAEQELVYSARAKAVPQLITAIESHLHNLAMAEAQIHISLAGAAGERVKFLLAANLGHEPLPLTQVASGGELSRVMLALRMVTGIGAPTLVFDEVDAGVGGVAAHAVGHSLSLLTDQVVVVTHLAQVAAHAKDHLFVEKSISDITEQPSARVHVLSQEERVVEMSRMISGSPNSKTAQQHAKELLVSTAQCSQATQCKVMR